MTDGEQMHTFQALSYLDKFRVSRFLTRGEAPDDPRMAVAAVELAESLQRQSRIYAALMRWWPVFLFVSLSFRAIPAAIGGDGEMAIFYALLVLVGIGNLMFNPAVRPKNVGRSLDASRRVVASGE